MLARQPYRIYVFCVVFARGQTSRSMWSAARWQYVLAALVLSFAAGAQAQTYPLKPIRVVVPLAPGGGNDTLARFISKQLSDGLAQQVIVENRPGGGGLVGGEYVARAAPDGYTLVVGGSGLIAV